MENSNFVIVFVSALGLSALWAFYFWFYWDYRIDKTRQELFSLRDELFDLAADGRISFHHPAYGLLRTTMNGMIRYTHRVDILHVLALLYASRHLQVENFLARFNEEINPIEDKDVKEKLLKLFLRMNGVVGKHLILGSIPLLIVVAVVSVCMIARQGWRDLTGRLSKRFLGVLGKIDSRAALEGTL